jgi:hypothetical protein
MSRIAKICLGLATAWQLVYTALFAGMLLRVLLSGFAPLPGGAAGLPEDFGALFVVHLGTLVLMLALAVWYVAEAARSPRVPRRWRALWIALVVVGGFVAQLAFWYAFIWRKPAPLETTLVGPPPPAG